MNSRHPILVLGYYTLGVLLVLLAVGPAVWLLNVALQPTTVTRAGRNVSYDLSQVTHPADYTLDNFRGVMNLPRAAVPLSQKLRAAWDQGLLRPFANSVGVTVLQTFFNVLLAALCAYPLARMRFPGKNFLFVMVLMTLMVPEQVIAVPLFVTIVNLHLYDTLLAVFLPFSVSALGIYLCREAFAAIPMDVEEAGRIDGASALQIWWHVMLPLARPTLATLAIFSIIGAWSNLLWPLIVLQDERKYTLPVAINQLLGVFGDDVRYAYAASVLALLPMVIVYALTQRWLARGLLAGAVKG
jgi:putative chitobiose transport system permease protein